MTTNTLTMTRLAISALAVCSSAIATLPAWAQTYPVTPAQKATANQVAKAGVPLSDLAPNAPERYTIKSGDTLWAISTLYLKSPWRWPELWGMNINDIKNPHLIYPGQVLVLERADGKATLRLAGADDGAGVPVVKVSPRTRSESLADSALPTIRSSVIEAFLAEPLVINEAEYAGAARIVSAPDSRVLITRGDRAYARGGNSGPLLDDQPKEKLFRVFRDAKVLKDPVTGEALGMEAIYAGKARMVRGETTTSVPEDGKEIPAVVPATVDIISAKEEIRVGDRLLPEPPRQLQTYAPHAPSGKISGRIVSVYGSAVVNAAQNQVVAINKGKQDGLDPGTVLAILSDGVRGVDKQDATLPVMKLPDERNGLVMIFRVFDRVSYGLILEIRDSVRIGDRLAEPR